MIQKNILLISGNDILHSRKNKKENGIQIIKKKYGKRQLNTGRIIAIVLTHIGENIGKRIRKNIKKCISARNKERKNEVYF